MSVNPENNAVNLAFFKLPKLETSDKVLLLTGLSLFLLGCFLFTLMVTYEHFAEIRQRKRVLLLKEAMIIPPRCEQKAEQIGMEAGKDWRRYFDKDKSSNE